METMGTPESFPSTGSEFFDYYTLIISGMLEREKIKMFRARTTMKKEIG